VGTSITEVRIASDADREWIYQLRHEVYARELGQHPCNAAGALCDELDETNVYVVAACGTERIGFVSITPPWVGRYSVEKYLHADEYALIEDPASGERPFEVRILTVHPQWRGSPAAPLLMYAALRWIASRGGRRIIAMGRTQVLELYLAAGLRLLGRPIAAGAVTFELMDGLVDDLARMALREHGPTLRRLAPQIEWTLDTPFLPGSNACEHGGASFDAIGRDFATLGRRHEVVAADVLDAWFPPAPGVVRALAEDPAWTARTSPPAGSEGLVAAIAAARDLNPRSIVVGAGSSDLIFRAFRGWLTPTSRVLLVDPTYGEYAHVIADVAGCRPRRLPVRRDQGWRIDLERLRAELRTGYDLVVLVNPNNPTGRYIPAEDLRRVLDDAPPSTWIWLDEAYIDYAGSGESLESYAATSANTVVCKSMSKMYALSGLRAAYLVASEETAAGLRRWTPPWAVSLPAQLAAVRALQDPAYYAGRWAQTASLRVELADGLAAALRFAGPELEIDQSVANFVLITLPRRGPTASQVAQACRARDVFLRDLSPLSPAFEGRTLRVAVKDAQANACIVATVRAVLEQLAGAVLPAVG